MYMLLVRLKIMGKGGIFLQKYDSEGEVLWTKQFGTPDSDYQLK